MPVTREVAKLAKMMQVECVSNLQLLELYDAVYSLKHGITLDAGQNDLIDAACLVAMMEATEQASKRPPVIAVDAAQVGHGAAH